MTNIYCKEDCLRTWAANSDMSRLDYFSPHKLADFHDAYFKNVMHRLSVGDIIYVKDPDGRRAELEILSLNDEDKTIQMGLIREVTVKPISASGFALEERRDGLRTKWCIIGPDGATVADDITGERNARRALEELESVQDDEAIGDMDADVSTAEAIVSKDTSPPVKRGRPAKKDAA